MDMNQLLLLALFDDPRFFPKVVKQAQNDPKSLEPFAEEIQQIDEAEQPKKDRKRGRP